MMADDPAGICEKERKDELVAREARGRRSLTTLISNGVVHLIAEYTGRGPTRARTTIDGRLVVCFVEDTFTRPEHSLLARGERDAVLHLRHSIQEAMKGELIALVEGLTGRKVVAFMSANHVDPDCALGAFVLDADVASRRPQGPTS
jgi:uncharacterized protein YbcI